MNELTDKANIRLLPKVGPSSEPADNVILMLRTLADEIENKEWGIVDEAALVFKTDEGVYHTFGWGSKVKEIPQAYYLFSKAANMLL